MKQLKLIALLPLLLMFAVYAAETEQKDRYVDQGAVGSFDVAAGKLAKLAEKMKGEPNHEPGVLLRWAETLYSKAKIEFRLAHGKVSRSGGVPDLKKYRSTLAQMKHPLTRLIQTYPKNSNIDRALYLRGKASEELGETNQAIQDYRAVLDRDSKGESAITTALALYDLMITQKQYSQAVQYLQRISVQPINENYALVQDRIAFAYFYMDEIDLAIKTQEKTFLSQKNKKEESGVSKSERDRAVNNLALFYGTGIEKKKPNFSSKGAIQLFKKWFTQDEFDSAVVHLGVFLRTKALENPLKELAQGTKKVEISWLWIGYLINRRELDQAAQEAKTVLGLISNDQKNSNDPHYSDKLQKTVLEVLKSIPQQDARDLEKSAPLQAVLYDILAQSTTNLKDQAKLRYNQGELHFRLKHFDVATAHYRWVVDQGMANGDLKDAPLKALSARYEQFKKEGLIPESLKAVPIKTEPNGTMPSGYSDWVEWADKAGAEEYQFETIRMLYAKGFIAKSLEKLVDWVKRRPKSKYSPAAAALTVDTFVVSQDWPAAYRMATGYLATKFFAGSDFEKKLQKTAADSAYQCIVIDYEQKKYAEALKKSELFLKNYPDHERKNDALQAAANSALAMGDKHRAMEFMKPMMGKESASSQNGAIARLTAAELAEENLDFAGASKLYAEVIKAGNKDSALLQKATTIQWLAGQEDLAWQGESYCNARPDRFSQCKSFGFSYYIKKGHLDKKFSLRTLKGNVAESDVLNNLFEVGKNKAAKTKPRIIAFATMLESWEKLDGWLKLQTLQPLLKLEKNLLSTARKDIRDKFAIKMDARSIQLRVAELTAFVERAENIHKRGMTEVQLEALDEMAGVYQDFADDLRKLQKGAEVPELAEVEKSFSEKAAGWKNQVQDMRMASAVNVNGLPAQTWSQYAGGSPLIASKLKEKNEEALGKKYKDYLTRAISEERWILASMLIDLGKQRGWLGSFDEAFLGACISGGAGASSLAFTEFNRLRTSGGRTEQRLILPILITAYKNVGAAEKVRALLIEAESAGLSDGTEAISARNWLKSVERVPAKVTDSATEEKKSK